MEIVGVGLQDERISLRPIFKDPTDVSSFRGSESLSRPNLELLFPSIPVYIT
jgi:hypothetical protein